jgi:hypothetical protein
MKKLIAFILIYLLWNILIYLSVSYYNLSFNPVCFGDGSRLDNIIAGVMAGFLVAWIITAAIADSGEEDDGLFF